MKFFGLIVPIGMFFGLMPLLKVFTAKELEHSFIDAGLTIEHEWQPRKGATVFIAAKKAV